MKKIRTAAIVCGQQMKIHYTKGKTFLVVCLMFFYIRGIVLPLSVFSEAVQEPITPWTFAILMNDNLFPFVITVFYIIWVCDAPFFTPMHLYIVGRCGKRIWMTGEILFLCLNSALYTAVSFLLMIFCSFPHFGSTRSWGKVLGTLAFTDAAGEYVMPFEINASVLNRFTPQQALFYTFLFMWGFFLFMGLLIFLFNWLTGQFVGTAVAFLLSALDVTITNMLSVRWRMISPVSMMRISTLFGGFSPSLKYVLIFLITGNLIIGAAMIFLTYIKKN